MFGVERVRAVLGRPAAKTAVEISTCLVDAVHDFSGDQLADDLAVLLIRTTRRPRAPRAGARVLADSRPTTPGGIHASRPDAL